MADRLKKGGGTFKRKDAHFRDTISDEPGAKFPAEPNRYHLYVSLACPWANRCLAVMKLKRLDKVMGLSIVHPCWGKTSDDPADKHTGWIFRKPTDPPVTPLCGNGAIASDDYCIPDPLYDSKSLRDLYDRAGAPPDAVRSVPVLWDTKTHTVVNNESSEIIRIFNGALSRMVGSDKDTPDLYPEALRGEIDSVNEWIYTDINNGVYKTGFTSSQELYEKNCTQLFKSLDRVEEILSRKRYLCGDQFTEADVRLFMTLIRFDEVYVVYFKCNKRPLSTYPNIHHYMRELYQMAWIGSSINMYHIKYHYYTSHPPFNSFAVVPMGPGVIEDMKLPHDRAAKNETTADGAGGGAK